MNILFDTQLLIWMAREPARLPDAARRMVADLDNTLHFSAASIWEIAIKHGLNRADFQFDPRKLRSNLLDQDFVEIAITGDHAVIIAELPPIHKDPFDRLLLAQAMFEGLTLLTADSQLARYPGPILRV